MPAIATELALELSRTDRRHGAQCAETKKVEALQLLGIERQLARGERSEEGACVIDLHQTPWSRARRGEAGREETGRETESRFATDRFQQSPPCFTDRFARANHSVQVEPRDAFISHLDHRGEVVE